MNKLAIGLLTVIFFTLNGFANETSEYYFKGGPISLEDVVQRLSNNGVHRFSGPLMGFWYKENRNAQVTGASPIVQDNQLQGWKIFWKKKSNPTYVSVEYLEVENPFLLPNGSPEEVVLKDMWNGVAKKFSYGKTIPLALNVVRKDGIATVRGLWYMQDQKTEVLFKPNGAITFSIPSMEMDRYLKAQENALTVRVPIPMAFKDHALQRPNLGEAVVMAPFKSSWTKWISIKPYLKGGKITEVRIEYVMKDTPAESVGLKAGLILKSIQGIEATGLTLTEFDVRMSATPIGKELVLEVSENKNGEFRMVKIPIHQIKGDVVTSVDPR